MTRMKVGLMLLVGAMGLGGGYASAQQGEEPPAPSTQAVPLDDDIEQEARALSPQEKIEQAQLRIEDMQKVLASTDELLERVRAEEQDLIKLNCINEKLAAMKGFIKVSEQSYVNLKEAVSRTDTEAEIHHYTLIAIANQKVNDLGEEALTCVGETQVFAGDTAVDRREDPDIADVELVTIDDDFFDDDFVTDRLPELTPFQ